MKAAKAAHPSTLAGRPGHNAGARYAAEVLTPAEVRAILATCRRCPTGDRDAALIVLMWRAGLRVSEALSLLSRDVDRDTGAIHVRHGKGGHERRSAIDPTALALVTRWLDARASLPLPKAGPLVCTVRAPAGRPLYPQQVRTMLARRAARAGVTRRVHPHALRHTHAAELAREGLPVNVIQAQLGHRSLSTTDRYLRHVAPEQLRAAIADRPGFA
jgi:site-specific recombinase XerD